MKRQIYFILFLLAVVSCSKDSEKDDGDKDILANQTLMFYIQSNNNLYSSLWNDIKEITECERKNDNNNVLIFVDSEAGKTPEYDQDKQWVVGQTKAKNQLFLVQNGKLIPVEGFEEQFKGKESSDIKTFKGVIEYCIEKFPAKKFGLSLGSHGSGWFPMDTKAIGGNDFTEKFLDIDEISDALPIKFDYIVFDACLMNDMTTLYELRNKANYIIASDMIIPMFGFNYNEALSYFLRNDLIGACESYINHYKGRKMPATITLTDTKYLTEIAALNKKIFSNYPHIGNSVEQLDKIQKCDLGYTYVDYVDFIDNYLGKNLAPEDDIRKLMDKMCCYRGWSGYQFPTITIDANKDSGYSQWLHQGENIYYLNEHKKYEWYTDAGLDLYLPKINSLYL